MAGGSSLGARRAFASSRLEPFYGPEVEAMKQIGIKNLDEGVVGYSFDLAPLREQSSAQECLNGSSSKGNVGEVGGSLPIDLIPLIQTSLIPLTPSKPHLINSTDGLDSIYTLCGWVTYFFLQGSANYLVIKQIRYHRLVLLHGYKLPTLGPFWTLHSNPVDIIRVLGFSNTSYPIKVDKVNPHIVGVK